jgi:predicted nucleotidyltransferase
LGILFIIRVHSKAISASWPSFFFLRLDVILRSTTDQLLQDYPVLQEMVRRLKAAFSPERIYLFGSWARGEGTPDSDFDLLLVIPDSSLPRYRRDQIAFRALTGIGVSKDVLVLTRAEFDRQRSVVCSLPATVEREGLLLYDS